MGAARQEEQGITNSQPTTIDHSDAATAATANLNAGGGAPTGQDGSSSNAGGRRAQTAPSLPPLMKGSRHSVLVSPALAPASGLGEELVSSSRVGFGSEKGAAGLGVGRRGKWQREAWVGEEEQDEQFPFLTEEDQTLLPDDRFEVWCCGHPIVASTSGFAVRKSKSLFSLRLRGQFNSTAPQELKIQNASDCDLSGSSFVSATMELYPNPSHGGKRARVLSNWTELTTPRHPPRLQGHPTELMIFSVFFSTLQRFNRELRG